MDSIQSPDGVTRKLGCLLPPTGFVSSFPIFETAVTSLSDAELKSIAQSGARDGRTLFDASFIKDQRSHGSCFPPGTLVRMADGSQKPIEKVQLLDEVLTAEGNRRRVLKVMVRPHTGNVYRLKVWGHRHLRATGEHPILTKRGYVAVDSLRKDEWVAIPRYMPQTVESIVPSEYVSVSLKSAQRKTYAHAAGNVPVGIPGKPSAVIVKTPLPVAIQLNAAFGRIVGLFLAEGSTTCGRTVFHFHENERHTLAEEVVRLFREEFGVTANVAINRGSKRLCEVKVYGTGWAVLFESLCRSGSGVKGLHSHLASGPREFLEAVLSGWQDGDGLGEPDRCGGVTVSHELAMNMYDIATALGHKPTVETLQVKINPRHKIKQRQLRYIVAWPKGDGEHNWKRSEQEESRVWRLVSEVAIEPYSGYVYNLEVEGDNSYVAEGIGVHNCNGFAGALALTRARIRRGLDREDLSGAYLYSLINGGGDNGSLLEDGMRAMQQFGIATEATVGWDAIYPGRYDRAKADAEAARFRAFECYSVKTQAGLWTALALGFDCVVAVHAGNRFMRVDGNGVVGVDQGPGNHAVGADGLVMVNNELAATGFNSWNRSYGKDGRMLMAWQHFAQPFGYHTFYAIRSTTDDPQGDNPPPAQG